MNDPQRKETEEIAELGVRRYFDYYLTKVFPDQIRRVIVAHNESVEAHKALLEPIQKAAGRMKRVAWMFAGGIAVGTFIASTPYLLKLLHLL